MGLLRRFSEAWRAFAAPAPSGAGSAYREAQNLGVTVDADEAQWRRLTGGSERDLTPLTQRRMRELAFYLWQANPLANRLIELPIVYLLAEGVRLEAKDPDAQAWLDAFWFDPINCMDIKLPKKVRELALFGEQCWPVFINEMNGHVRLGYLDPDLIETVVVDPDNAEQPIGVVTVKDKSGRARRYRIIINGPESVFSRRTREIRRTFDTGECFYFKVNDLSNGTRGRSDLLANMDWLDAYEQFLFGEIERGNFLRAFMWDVTLSGATPDEVKARAREIVAPKPGSVRVHNDSESWQAVTPDLNAEDSASAARLFRNHILGGATFPEHWYGGGGDVNRATAAEMGDPTFKFFSHRQRQWKYILEMVGGFVVWRRLDPAGTSEFEPLALDEDLRPQAVFPELLTEDTSKYASALQQVTMAAGIAVDRGMIPEVLAVRLIEAVAGRLGVEFDAEAALAEAREEATRRRAEDAFAEEPEGDPPDPPDRPEAGRSTGSADGQGLEPERTDGGNGRRAQ